MRTSNPDQHQPSHEGIRPRPNQLTAWSWHAALIWPWITDTIEQFRQGGNFSKPDISGRASSTQIGGHGFLKRHGQYIPPTTREHRLHGRLQGIRATPYSMTNEGTDRVVTEFAEAPTRLTRQHLKLAQHRCWTRMVPSVSSTIGTLAWRAVLLSVVHQLFVSLVFVFDSQRKRRPSCLLRPSHWTSCASSHRTHSHITTHRETVAQRQATSNEIQGA